MHGLCPCICEKNSKKQIVPGCGSGDDLGEASCHESDAPRLVTLRLDHAPAVAAVTF
jgi:hypothetical protein